MASVGSDSVGRSWTLTAHRCPMARVTDVCAISAQKRRAVLVTIDLFFKSEALFRRYRDSPALGPVVLNACTAPIQPWSSGFPSTVFSSLNLLSSSSSARLDRRARYARGAAICAPTRGGTRLSVRGGAPSHICKCSSARIARTTRERLPAPFLT